MRETPWLWFLEYDIPLTLEYVTSDVDSVQQLRRFSFRAVSLALILYNSSDKIEPCGKRASIVTRNNLSTRKSVTCLLMTVLMIRRYIL